MKQSRLSNLWPGRRNLDTDVLLSPARHRRHHGYGWDRSCRYDEAREHADTVARELTFKTTGILGEEWSKWTMVVNDAAGLELFSFGMSTVRNGNGK
jgi:hypothetical protein